MIKTDFTKKIDFVFTVGVERCNPNGDPNNGNRPRVWDKDGVEYGVITSECIKHKIRERLNEFYEDSNEAGCEVFHRVRKSGETVKSILKKDIEELHLKDKDDDTIAKAIYGKYIDNRAFGNLLAVKAKKKETEEESLAIPMPGAVQITDGHSIDPITIDTICITKCVATQEAGKKEDGDSVGAGKMGNRYVVNNATYVFWGSMFPRNAEKSGFSVSDANKVIEAIKTVFANDASAARPAGSMWIQDYKFHEHTTKDGDFSMRDFQNRINIDKNGVITMN